MNSFSHLDAEGSARMVEVGHKADLQREAQAIGFIQLAASTLEQLKAQALPKGDVLTVAKIAAIQAAKRTSELIPLCHPLPLTGIDVAFAVTVEGIEITATVRTTGKTGVEMEALTAVSVAALTIYDMCKAVDSGMIVQGVQLVYKKKEPA